jgi:hypothetical protein
MTKEKGGPKFFPASPFLLKFSVSIRPHASADYTSLATAWLRVMTSEAAL